MAICEGRNLRLQIVLPDPFLKSCIQACTVVEESVEGAFLPLFA